MFTINFPKYHSKDLRVPTLRCDASLGKVRPSILGDQTVPSVFWESILDAKFTNVLIKLFLSFFFVFLLQGSPLTSNLRVFLARNLPNYMLKHGSLTITSPLRNHRFSQKQPRQRVRVIFGLATRYFPRILFRNGVMGHLQMGLPGIISPYLWCLFGAPLDL